MAIKSTIIKVNLQIADMERHLKCGSHKTAVSLNGLKI